MGSPAPPSPRRRCRWLRASLSRRLSCGHRCRLRLDDRDDLVIGVSDPGDANPIEVGDPQLVQRIPGTPLSRSVTGISGPTVRCLNAMSLSFRSNVILIPATDEP